MRLITLTDEDTGTTVARIVSPGDLDTLSGVELAALLFPSPTDTDITTINAFLDHYRSDGT